MFVSLTAVSVANSIIFISYPSIGIFGGRSWSSELELEAGVRSWSSELELESGGLGVGGGAKVRASGYGVFAEVPRGEAFGHRRRYPHYNGSAILTVVPSPILLDIVIFPPSSAVRRSIPESP